ncbi:SPOR domain-containing protein [Clostridium sp. C2-6-12]|uniref:SPOR domain-containing protein n=1 Tax=Clostridium sp. C2-6-12 TaxID=2698832 RepID=UPI0013688D28|nr:SPOR domain-containing protein [Clostridium sp. C2-6-12]
MRYTRYEYKKFSKLRFLFTVSIITLISIGGGLYMSNFAFQEKQIEDSLKPSSKADNANQDEKFMALQCGYYAKEENAKELLNSISKYCEPFIVEDEGKYRVLAGIYKEEDGIKKIQEFKANNIDIAKVSLNIQGDKLETQKITEIIDGLLTISNKLEEKEVKSINTSEFKTWADTVINDGGVKSKKLEDINNYVKALPEEIDKSGNNKNFEELYKLIKK